MPEASLQLFIVFIVNYTDPYESFHDTFSVRCYPDELHLEIYDRCRTPSEKRTAKSMRQLIEEWRNEDSIADENDDYPSVRVEVYNSEGNHLFQENEEIITNKYFFLDKANNPVKILAENFRLQINRTCQEPENYLLIKDSRDLEEACDIVLNKRRWSIVRIADNAKISVTPEIYSSQSHS